MKYCFLICIAAVCMVAACNNASTPAGESVTDNKDSLKKTPASKEEMDTESELQSFSPYSAGQIRALLPEELAGGRLTDPSSGKVTGTAYAKGVYTVNDSTAIELSLFDCGGSEGAGFYKYQFLNMLQAEPSGEDEEVTISDFNGSKAIEHYDNNSYRSLFTYLDGRVLVTLGSESVDINGLKKIARGLKLK